MVKVAIMQPHFLPYYGFFSLMKEADIFILLDNVQFSKQSWQQRNKVQIDGKDKWLTVPIIQKTERGLDDYLQPRMTSKKLIKDVQLADHSVIYAMQNMLKLEFNYQLVFSPLFDLLSIDLVNILDIRDRLGIKTPILLASLLQETDIVKLTETVGGTEYISTGGSRVYFDDELENRFMNKGVTVKFNDYEPDYSIVQYLDNKKYLKDRGVIA